MKGCVYVGRQTNLFRRASNPRSVPNLSVGRIFRERVKREHGVCVVLQRCDDCDAGLMQGHSDRVTNVRSDA